MSTDIAELSVSSSPEIPLAPPPAPTYEAPLPLVRIDRALQPIRRVLAWATRDLADRADRVRYLEVNGSRALERLRGLDLVGPVAESVDAVRAALAGFDESAGEARAERIREGFAAIGRLDAVLGLPLRTKAVEEPGPDVLPAFDEPLDLPTEESDGPGTIDAVAEPEDDIDEGDRRFRLGDPAQTGRPLSSLGIDAGVVALLAEEGVETVADLLLLAPSGEEVLRPVHGAGRDLPQNGGRIAVGGRVRSRATVFGPKGRHTEIWITGAGPLRAIFLGGAPPALIERLTPGARVVFVGEPGVDERGESMILDPEPVLAEGHAVHLAKYGIEGVDDRVVRGLVWRFLPEADRVRDPIDAARRDRLGLIPLSEAIRDAHAKISARPEARHRLAFDEALLLQLGLASARFNAVRERGIPHPVTHGLAIRLLQQLDLQLDDSQQAALEEIKRDLRDGAAMTRVLTGEPGTGKWIVAMLAAVIVAEGKSQVVFVLPDPTTAEQRFQHAEAVLKEIGLVGRLVSGEPTKAQRDAIRRGEVHIVFGSADLLERNVEFRRLGLVVAEEREQFGRAPARVAAMRAPRPDLLVVGTTPMATSVLLSAYGDHDLSVVERRIEVRCSIVDDQHRDTAYARARDALDARRQAMVVFPLARPRNGDEGSVGHDVLDPTEARQVVQALTVELLPSAKIGLYHGAAPREERARTWDDFAHRRLDVLVATTHVEDGPQVPGARTLIVEQADRMPLHRLLRLRGFIGEGGEIVFVTGSPSDPAGVARLELIAGLTTLPQRKDAPQKGRDRNKPEFDAWAFAEWDVEQRGLDNVLFREQGGSARLRWLEPARDREILLAAREHALAILNDDPGLRRGATGDLGRTLRERWEDLVSTPCPLPDGGAPSAAANKRRRRRRKRR